MPTAQLSLFEQFRADDPSLGDDGVVVAICEEILREAGATPPVDVELLVSLCGIVDVEYGRQLWSGMLFQRDGRLVARIREDDGLERRRFTVLHEGGHTFLPGFRRARQHRCKGPKTLEEHLCDLAAAELLLPRNEFVLDAARSDAGLAGVEQLAERYIASHQATAVRLVTLSTEPVMLLVLRYGNKPSERGKDVACLPKLRLAWSVRQGTWPYPLPHKSVSRESPIARAWEHEVVDEIANVDELLSHPQGPVLVSARRYGDSVLAMVRPLRFH
ncbi:MAG TPA: ImmA/IrrE family metallo-endopeptidase [Conexibacter sp.]|nr:ImmA/IrrE family metallo-endopeptidase [Conexibacter sp.]